MAPKSEKSVSIIDVEEEQFKCYILGSTPLLVRRMSQKGGMQELLFPKGRKTTAEKARSLKHNPFQEFRDSPYTLPEGSPTLLAGLATWFKKAIAGAAIDIPGATKAQVGRLLWVEGELLPLYGIPQIHMAVTRSADMNRTPDIRTRAIIPHWAMEIDITFITPLLNASVVGNLLGAAGLIRGVGDWRPEKGSGTFGQFRLVAPNDERWLEIVKNGGREAQEKAMEDPQPYNRETEESLTWFVQEYRARGHEEPL